MDFGLNEAQLALQDLAKKVFRGLAPVESLPAVEAQPDRFHRVLWDGLVKSQLLAAALPAAVGGGGMGVVEACLLLEQAGDAVAPVPLLPTLSAALPIARFGTAEQQSRWLEPVARGASILTAALTEVAEPARATQSGDDYLLSGVFPCVPALELASHVLLPAQVGDQLAMFVIDTRAPGVTIERQIGTNEDVLGRLSLREVRLTAGERLGAPTEGAAILDFSLERAWTGQCALELGIARRALILTAKYSSERQQFGRAIGSFQAVAQRAADAYVDVELIRLTVFRAAFLLDQGLDARREVAVAKMTAAQAGHRVVCAAQHIHGGIGFDRDYPLYRYFLASKQNEFSLGSAAYHTARLGRLLAED